MSSDDLIQALRRLKVETGSLACLGCGYEHNCSTQGCAILRQAVEEMEKAKDDRLERCPFCGGEPEIKEVTRHVENNLIVVKCTRCGASTKTFVENKSQNAVMAWNRRTYDGLHL